MLVLNLPFKALMFLTLMRPSLVLFLVLWLKLVKDFLKVRCRLDRKSGSAGMPRPISYAVFCLKKKRSENGEFEWSPTLVVAMLDSVIWSGQFTLDIVMRIHAQSQEQA